MHASTSVKKLFHSLESAKLTLVTAESLTGGLIGSELTSIPGSSEIFWGGLLTYSADAKIRLLGVDPLIIDDYGVVSKEAVEAMAAGALAISGADISIAVSGIAGPSGGTEDTPVGTVWIASARRSSGSIDIPGVQSICCHFKGSRERIRTETVKAAACLAITHLDSV